MVELPPGPTFSLPPKTAQVPLPSDMPPAQKVLVTTFTGVQIELGYPTPRPRRMTVDAAALPSVLSRMTTLPGALLNIIIPETEDEPTISLPPGVAAIDKVAVATRAAAAAATVLRLLDMAGQAGCRWGSRGLFVYVFVRCATIC